MEETKKDENLTSSSEKDSTNAVKTTDTADSKEVKKEDSLNTDNNKSTTAKTNKKTDSEKKPKKKMGKFKKTLIFLIVIVIISAIASLVYFLGFAAKTVDLSSYITLEYEGYNGKATATTSIDTDALGDYLNDKSLAKKFAKKVELELDKSTNLSNGDEVTVKISISKNWLKENKLDLKDKSVTITVSGIDEPNTIDLSKYLDVEYDGLNKDATAEVSIDTTALGKFLDNTSLATQFASKATLTISNNSGLTNGDDLTVKVSIDEDWLEQNGLELKSTTVKIEIKGLEEGTEIDVFKDIEISVSGMSPSMKISVINTSSDEFLKTVTYTLSKSTGISNGETITITAASWDKDMAKEKGYVISETTYEYTVSSEVSYPMSTSELTSATIESLKSEFSTRVATNASDSGWQKIHDNYTDYKTAGENAGFNDGRGYSSWYNLTAWSSDLSAGTPQICAMYLLTAKDSSDTYNYVYAIYKVSFKSALTGLNYDWFFTASAKNLSIKSDGSLTENAVYDVTSDNGSTQDTAYDKYINSKKNDYTVEKINY